MNATATQPVETPLPAIPPADRKPGAPCGNRNSLRNGKRAKQSLVLGTAGPGTAYAIAGARKTADEYRESVQQARGSVTPLEDSLLLELAEWEATRRLSWRLLRLESGKLTIDQQIELRRDCNKAMAERNKLLKSLRLDGRDSKPVSALKAFHESRQQAQEDRA